MVKSDKTTIRLDLEKQTKEARAREVACQLQRIRDEVIDEANTAAAQGKDCIFLSANIRETVWLYYREAMELGLDWESCSPEAWDGEDVIISWKS